MIQLITCIRDVKAGLYMSAMLAVRTEGEAKRHYMNMLNSAAPSSSFQRYPKDYAIYLLGSFDPETGEIIAQFPKDITPHSDVDAYIAFTTKKGDHDADR